jgi:hypothetical protein
MYEPDKFIDVLTHELLHRLLTDNTTISYDTNLRRTWSELFGRDHKPATLVHIPVHAVHKAIYLDVLKEPSRFERDFAGNKKHEAVPYIEAWAYVEENGYKEIIEQLRQSYKDIGTVK